MRDLGSMAAAAIEQCRVWPKTAAQGVKCVRVHCHGAGSSRHPTIFPVVFGELIHTTSQDLQVEFLVNCLTVESVRMVYDTLRINHFLVSRC